MIVFEFMSYYLQKGLRLRFANRCLRVKGFLLAGVLAISLHACNEECYDASLVHHDGCTTDCPGVCGCDGKTYCNTCEAHRNGIEVVYNSACH